MRGRRIQLKKLAVVTGAVLIAVNGAVAQTQIKPSLDDLGGEVSSFDLSPDGKTLAFDWCGGPNFECRIYTRPVAGGPMKLVVSRGDGEGFVGSPRWSPDGKMIAFTDSRDRWDVRLDVLNLASGAERELGPFCYERVGQSPLSWSPDSRWIAANRNMGGTWVTLPHCFQPAASQSATWRNGAIPSAR